MAVIYGRRRVALIKKFIENKPAIYIQGIEATKELNLQYLSNAIMDFENPMQIPTSFSYGDFKDAFVAVENIANHQKEDLPLDPREIKNWWRYNPILKRQEEVGLVAIDFDNSQALIGECKWKSAQKLTHEMLTTLQRRADLVAQQINVKVAGLYFFVMIQRNHLIFMIRWLMDRDNVVISLLN